MSQSLRDYLLSLVVGSFVTSVVLALVPKGSIRRAAAFTCGLFLCLCALSPVMEINYESIALSLSRLQIQAEQARTGIEVKNRELVSAIIKQNTQAYILDKAESMGLDVEVEIGMKDTGDGPYPYLVTITGAVTQSQKNSLMQMITDQFSIAPERQVWKYS